VGLAVAVAGQEDLGVLPVASVLRGPVLVQVQLVLRVDDPVLVGIHHLEQIFGFPVCDFQTCDFFHRAFEFTLLYLLVEYMVLKVIHISEEVL